MSMDFKSLLNQVLVSGNKLAGKASTGAGKSTGGLSDMTRGALGGAAGGSLVTMQELSRELNLAPELVKRLESQVN